jgi:hypothetical protein
MARPILDSEEFIDNLIKLIESHLLTVEGTIFTTATYPPSVTPQPGVANWKGYEIPTPDEYDKQQKANEERNAGTPPPTPPSPEPTPSPSPGGGEPENDNDVDVIFVSGITSAISFTSQVNAFKESYTPNAIIKSFRHEASNLPAIREVLKLNPKIPVFLFSAGCQRITGLIDDPNLDKTKVFLIEPYTVETTGRRNMESAIDKGVPSKNLYAGPTSDRGKNVDRDTTKVPTTTGHLEALRLAAKENQQ